MQKALGKTTVASGEVIHWRTWGLWSLAKEAAARREREAYLQSQVNELWRTLPTKKASAAEEIESRYPPEPQENLLYFAEKNAPLLEP